METLFDKYADLKDAIEKAKLAAAKEMEEVVTDPLQHAKDATADADTKKDGFIVKTAVAHFQDESC